MSETPKLWLCHRNGIMVESEKFGEYIRLTDYRQLERALTQAQARCAVLTGLLREVYGEFAKRHIRSTDLQSRIDEALGNSSSSEVDG